MFPMMKGIYDTFYCQINKLSSLLNKCNILGNTLTFIYFYCTIIGLIAPHIFDVLELSVNPDVSPFDGISKRKFLQHNQVKKHIQTTSRFASPGAIPLHPTRRDVNVAASFMSVARMARLGRLYIEKKILREQCEI